MVWSTTPPAPIRKPGWTTDPTIIIPAGGTQEWAAKYTRRAALELTASLAVAGAPHVAGAANLGLTATLGAAAAEHYARAADLALTANLGAALPPPIPGSADLGLTATLAAEAAERYSGAADLGLTASLGATAAEHYVRAADLGLTVALSGTATSRYPGAADLGLTATLVAAGALAPVKFDNDSDGGSGGTSTRSWTHNNQGNCIVVVLTNTTSSNPTCTYGGVNIPRVYGPSSDGGVFPYTSYISIYALVSSSLPKGNNTVSVNQAGTASAAGAVSFQNAGSIGTVSADTASGNINKAASPGANGAAVAAYVGGSNNFGAFTPNEVMRYGFITFVTWATAMAYGLGNVTFAATHSGAKTGATVLILPAT